MKKSLCVLLAALLLAGCSSTSAPSTTPTATPEATPEVTTMDTETEATTANQVDTERGDMDIVPQLYWRETLHNSYNPEQNVTEEELDLILQAAFSAPTGGNQRSLEFFVVTDRSVMEIIQTGHPYSEALTTAPLVIVVTANQPVSKYTELEEMDSGLAAMAMLTEATDLGLTTLVMSIAPQEERVNATKEALNLTDDYQPILMVAFGHPAVDTETGASVNNYTESQVHINGLE